MNSGAFYLLLIGLMLSMVTAYVHQARHSAIARTASSTSLFAHHPQMKIIKKKMHRRPKKHRPSDITRNNVNFNKCITKIEGAPSDYTIVEEKDVEKIIALSKSFWENGDPEAEWHAVTEEDLQYGIFLGTEPVPKSEKKKPAFPRSGSK